MLKQLKEALAGPISIIINSCIDEAVSPELMKVPRVVPINKKKNPGNFGNYRPIFWLPVILKAHNRRMKVYINK